MRKVLIGGVEVGSSKFWILEYADDMVLVAGREGNMKLMMEKLERYLNLNREKLCLNVEKQERLYLANKEDKKEKCSACQKIEK